VQGVGSPRASVMTREVLTNSHSSLGFSPGSSFLGSSLLGPSAPRVAQVTQHTELDTEWRLRDDALKTLQDDFMHQQDLLVKIAEQLLGGTLQREMVQRMRECEDIRHQQELQSAALREGLMELAQVKEDLGQLSADVSEIATGLARVAEQPPPPPAAASAAAEASSSETVAVQREMAALQRETAQELSSWIASSRKAFAELRSEIQASVGGEREARGSLRAELRTLIDRVNNDVRCEIEALADMALTPSAGHAAAICLISSRGISREEVRVRTDALRMTLASVQQDQGCSPSDKGGASPEAALGLGDEPFGRRGTAAEGASSAPTSPTTGGLALAMAPLPMARGSPRPDGWSLRAVLAAAASETEARLSATASRPGSASLREATPTDAVDVAG